MTPRDLERLMAKIVAFDGRDPGAAELTAWQDAARVAQWSLPEALDAVTEHYANTLEWIRPAHVTEYIRQSRRGAVRCENDRRALRGLPPIALADATTGEPVDLDGPVDAGKGPEGLPLGADVPGRPMSAALRQVHEDANAVACPTCKAAKCDGSDAPHADVFRCRYPDGRLTRIPHVARMVLARKTVEARLRGEPPPPPKYRDVDESAALEWTCPTCRAAPASPCTQRLDRTRTVPTHDSRKAVAAEAMRTAGQSARPEPVGLGPV